MWLRTHIFIKSLACVTNFRKMNWTTAEANGFSAAKFAFPFVFWGGFTCWVTILSVSYSPESFPKSNVIKLTK